jgi:hypothetical protein
VAGGSKEGEGGWKKAKKGRRIGEQESQNKCSEYNFSVSKIVEKKSS